MNPQEKTLLQEMKSKIEQIEKLACELNDLGQGVPVIEKNVKIFLNTVFVLKFGISDITEIDAA
jgi:uncharacterized protein YoxC